MKEKTKCILAYVFSWIGGLIVLYGLKDNEKNTKFHAAQAIVIGLGYMIITAIYRFLPIYIPFLSTAISVIYLLCMVFGIIKACNGDDPEIPVVGSLAKSIFGKKI
ncbi:MAG: DUF4870 domain-containing protein, partial [Clostridia bacterium]|nr:DUF4870 domain-containing protein [Clostridia bacterium]